MAGLSFFRRLNNVQSKFNDSVFIDSPCTIQWLSADKKARLTAAGYSAVFIPSRSESTSSLNCFCIRFMFLRKNRFRATSQLLPPRTRVARNPSAKNYRFCFGLPPFRRQRRAERSGCAAVGRFTSLPCPLSRFPFFHVLVSGHLFVYSFFTLPRHQLDVSRLPVGTLGCHQAQAASC